jgi:hypothetical protein
MLCIYKRIYLSFELTTLVSSLVLLGAIGYAVRDPRLSSSSPPPLFYAGSYCFKWCQLLTLVVVTYLVILDLLLVYH